MEWEEWRRIYKKILEDFGFEEARDEEAARIAAGIKKSNISLGEMKKIISGKVVTICGAGENLEEEIGEIEGVVIAADEATSVLMANGIFPHIIATDLDGNIEDIIDANEKGSIAIVHAHGDNMDALRKYLPLFRGKILLTTQAKPFNEIYNFGGFTDGDRAYCLARHFKAREIKLVGFDFEKPREKEGKDMEVKKKKLEWARKIIEMSQN